MKIKNFIKLLNVFLIFCLSTLFFSCTETDLPSKALLPVAPTPTPTSTPTGYSESEYTAPEDARFQILEPEDYFLGGLTIPLSPYLFSEIYTKYPNYPGSKIYSTVPRGGYGLSDMIDMRNFFATPEVDTNLFKSFARFWVSSSVLNIPDHLGDYKEAPTYYMTVKANLKKLLYFVGAKFPTGNLSLWKTTGVKEETTEVLTLFQDHALTSPKDFSLIERYPEFMQDEGYYYIGFLSKDSFDKVGINVFDPQTSLVSTITLTDRYYPRFLKTITHDGKEKFLFVARDELDGKDGIYMLDPDIPTVLNEVVSSKNYEIKNLITHSEVQGPLLKEKLFFVAKDNMTNEICIWASDGNLEVGTTVKKIAINGTITNYNPQELTPFRIDGKVHVVFSADDGVSGKRAYVTNGGSAFVLDNWDITENSRNPHDFTVVNFAGEDTLIYFADIVTTYLDDAGLINEKIEKTIWTSNGVFQDAIPLWIAPKNLGLNPKNLSLRRVYEYNHLRDKLYYEIETEDHGHTSKSIDVASVQDFRGEVTPPKFVFKMPPTSYYGPSVIDAVNVSFGETIRLYSSPACNQMSEIAITIAHDNYAEFYFDYLTLHSFETTPPYASPRNFQFYGKKVLRGGVRESDCVFVELRY